MSKEEWQPEKLMFDLEPNEVLLPELGEESPWACEVQALYCVRANKPIPPEVMDAVMTRTRRDTEGCINRNFNEWLDAIKEGKEDIAKFAVLPSLCRSIVCSHGKETQEKKDDRAKRLQMLLDICFAQEILSELF